MSTAFVGLGSNLGDRLHNLKAAWQELSWLPGTKAVTASSLYETEPVEFADQPYFLNQVVQLETTLDPEELLEELLRIEAHLGRTRTVPKGPRTLDLDLLLFDQLIIETPRLTLPHPALHRRRFVLVPLAEIAPAVLHPILRKKMVALLAELSDQSSVQMYRKREAATAATLSTAVPSSKEG